MILDNKSSIIRIKQSGLIYTLLFVVFIMVLLYIKKDPFINLGFSKTIVTIISSTLYAYFIVSRYIKNYNYFAFQETEQKLIFRYYSLRPFNKTRKTIEIEKDKFAGCRIAYSKMKVKQHLILYKKSAEGLRQYPKISVSAVSKKNLLTLTKILNKFIQE